MLNLVIFGAPGSGKGTQSERLIETYGLYHISTGEVLRGQIACGTELGRLADSFISQGHLIPDDLMVRVLAAELDNHPDEVAHGLIFDGFPRTIPQAIALKDLLEQRGTTLHGVIGLEVAEDELIVRLIKRGQETGRADDNLDTIKERLVVYHNQTAPLREYYENEGLYHAIDGHGTVDEIFAKVKTTVDGL